jgi:glycosyltransferase involved in cell wall biosynthesis
VYWALGSVLRTVKVPCIFTCFGSVKTKSKSLFKAFWWQRALTMYSRLASYAYTDSIALSMLLQTKGLAADRIAIIPLQAVDVTAIKAVPAPPVAWDISVVTPLSGAHNLHRLIDIVKSIPNCRMLVIGGGVQKNDLMAHVKEQSLDGRIQFTGWFPGKDEVISSIKSTRMFVCTAEHLQTQYMLLNVLACEVPVIVQPSELTSGIIDHQQNGLLTTGTLKDLEQNILWFLQSQEQRQFLAERALHDVERFNEFILKQQWKKFVQAVKSGSLLNL